MNAGRDTRAGSVGHFRLFTMRRSTTDDHGAPDRPVIMERQHGSIAQGRPVITTYHVHVPARCFFAMAPWPMISSSRRRSLAAFARRSIAAVSRRRRARSSTQRRRSLFVFKARSDRYIKTKTREMIRSSLRFKQHKNFRRVSVVQGSRGSDCS